MIDEVREQYSYQSNMASVSVALFPLCDDEVVSKLPHPWSYHYTFGSEMHTMLEDELWSPCNIFYLKA